MDNDFATGYALGSDSNGGNCNNGGFWGGDGWWAIIIFCHDLRLGPRWFRRLRWWRCQH